MSSNIFFNRVDALAYAAEQLHKFAMTAEMINILGEVDLDGSAVKKATEQDPRIKDLISSFPDPKLQAKAAKEAAQWLEEQVMIEKRAAASAGEWTRA